MRKWLSLYTPVRAISRGYLRIFIVDYDTE